MFYLEYYIKSWRLVIGTTFTTGQGQNIFGCKRFQTVPVRPGGKGSLETRWSVGGMGKVILNQPKMHTILCIFG
jgi:hypothetical protein